MPAYVAHEKGFFRDAGIDTTLHVESTASAIPDRLLNGHTQFAVMPWTRVAMAHQDRQPLVLIAGSGIEEAAIVLRTGVRPESVKRIAVPRRGGIKDLTAMGLMQILGWSDVDLLNLPSGDAAILALVGRGADAASMVEPYATMIEALGIGTVLKRTGDLWPGAPGCSLTTTERMIDEHPAVVSAVVRAFLAGARHVHAQPDESAEIAAPYIGIDATFIRAALEVNRPDVHAIRNTGAMEQVLALMRQLDYGGGVPNGYRNLTFLDHALGPADRR